MYSKSGEQEQMHPGEETIIAAINLNKNRVIVTTSKYTSHSSILHCSPNSNSSFGVLFHHFIARKY